VPSYAEQAYGLIRSFIVDGTYHPGEQLGEVEIASRLGISRSPVREAFQKLAMEGLVDLVSRRGAFVATFDVARVSALFEVREALFGMAARLAATRGADDALRNLARILTATRAILDRSEASSYPSDLDFHRGIALAAGNKPLADKALEVELQVQLARLRSTGGRPARARNAYREHEAVLDALRARDGDRAEREMRRHVRNGLASVREALTQQQTAARRPAGTRTPRQSRGGRIAFPDEPGEEAR